MRRIAMVLVAICLLAGAALGADSGFVGWMERPGLTQYAVNFIDGGSVIKAEALPYIGTFVTNEVAVAAIGATPNSTLWVQSASPTVTVTLTDAESGIYSYEKSADGVAWGGPVTYITPQAQQIVDVPVTLDATGSTSLYIRATDFAGLSQVYGVSIKRDANPPTITITVKVK